MFGCTSKNLEKFLRKYVENLQLSYENNTGDHIIHAVRPIFWRSPGRTRPLQKSDEIHPANRL